jgi:transketolase
MNVVAPAGAEDVEHIAQMSYDFPGPLYIRLGRTDPRFKYSHNPLFKIGKGIVVQEGKDAAIFAIGDMVYEAQQAIGLLKKKGLSVALINMHTLKPLDVPLIKKYARSCSNIFTVEEHSIIGGLGSAVAEVLAESEYKGRFQRIGISEKLLKVNGTGQHLREKQGLVFQCIAKKILKCIR